MDAKYLKIVILFCLEKTLYLIIEQNNNMFYYKCTYRIP